MPYTAEAVEQFFQTYARHSSSGDTAALVAHFADTFLAAGPHGAQPTRAADFVLALPRRRQLVEAAGRVSSSLVSVRQIPLDARYLLARTRWRLDFSRPEPLSLHLDSDFLLDTGGDRFKIILYLANQDIMTVLRDAGISLPQSPSPS